MSSISYLNTIMALLEQQTSAIKTDPISGIYNVIIHYCFTIATGTLRNVFANLYLLAATDQFFRWRLH